MDIEPAKYYRLVPKGALPSGDYVHRVDGRSVRVPWKSGTVQASSKCEVPGHNNGNVPVLHVSVLESLAREGMIEKLD